MRPAKNDYFPYLETYISKVKEENAVSALESGLTNTLQCLKKIPFEKWDFRYGTDKWSIKELVMHTIDVERVFAYRALAFARGEMQTLPAFDENEYAKHSEANAKSPVVILEELESVRASTICLFKGFSVQALKKCGHVPAGVISVNALAFAICGHSAHHMEVLVERYLK